MLDIAYNNITSNAKLTPDDIEMETSNKKVGFLMRSPMSAKGLSRFSGDAVHLNLVN